MTKHISDPDPQCRAVNPGSSHQSLELEESTTKIWPQTMRPDLAKFHHFVQAVKVFGNF